MYIVERLLVTSSIAKNVLLNHNQLIKGVVTEETESYRNANMHKDNRCIYVFNYNNTNYRGLCPNISYHTGDSIIVVFYPYYPRVNEPLEFYKEDIGYYK